MFDGLTGRLGDIFGRLGKRAVLSDDDVNDALREIRIALLEADVALPVVKDFIADIKGKAIGQDTLRGINPAQQVVKIVHDALVEMLGPAVDSQSLLKGAAPLAVLMVGLQGSGKTTTTGKIGLRLKDKERKKVLMASLDVHRPAAQEQLRQLGMQTGITTLPIIDGQKPLEIARRAMETARLEGYDVVLLDTAGRLTIDTVLMAEVAEVQKAVNPAEILLVADAMTGQDAVNTARAFDELLPLTGIVLTRVDGDARGGAALSMRAVTGKPLRLLGVGEKLDALEIYSPDRLAGRILGKGDIVGLVERAVEAIDQDEAANMASKMMSGRFDLDDLAGQLRMMGKMGGMSGIMGMLPGIAKAKAAMAENAVDDKQLARMQAIISAMTKAERKDPRILNASRRRRIALGAGTQVSEVNKILKMHQNMAEMMKSVKKMGMGGGKGLSRMLSGMAGKGGMPNMPSLPNMPNGAMPTLPPGMKMPFNLKPPKKN